MNDPNSNAFEATQRICRTNERCLALAIEALGRIKRGVSAPSVEATLAIQAIESLLAEDLHQMARETSSVIELGVGR